MPQIPEICRLFTSPRSEDEFFNTDKRVFGDCLSGKLLKGEAATLPSPVAMHGRQAIHYLLLGYVAMHGMVAFQAEVTRKGDMHTTQWCPRPHFRHTDFMACKGLKE
eukprot:s2958_g6.t1